MRYIVWPSDEGACGFYRLMFPATALAGDHDVDINFDGPKVLWEGDEWRHRSDLHPPSDVVVRGLAERPDADVVVIQRPARRWWADLIPYLQAAGVGVVVDVDDRFDRIPKANVAESSFTRGAKPDFGWEHIDRACRLADVVTASTPALVERFGYGHGYVLPNLVPASYLRIEEPRKPKTVGWSGSIEVHPDDLQATKGAVPPTLRETGWRFHVIGTGVGVRDGLGLDADPTSSGFAPFEEYPHLLANLEVGIVPLALNTFNQSKSALKMCEMASVGVPVVVSPTPDNLRMHRLGIGLVAETHSQWRKRLRQVILNADLRADLAGRGREVMATQTYESRADRWLAVWEKAKRTQ